MAGEHDNWGQRQRRRAERLLALLAISWLATIAVTGVVVLLIRGA